MAKGPAVPSTRVHGKRPVSTSSKASTTSPSASGFKTPSNKGTSAVRSDDEKIKSKTPLEVLKDIKNGKNKNRVIVGTENNKTTKKDEKRRLEKIARAKALMAEDAKRQAALAEKEKQKKKEEKAAAKEKAAQDAEHAKKEAELAATKKAE